MKLVFIKLYIVLCGEHLQMSYSHKIIQSDDGSNTLFVPELNETYHSTHGAIQEARHVFIKTGLQYLLDENREQINVFEVGFGTGLNAILAYEFAELNNIKINYHTIEAYPISQELASNLNYFEQINKDLTSVFTQLHRCEWNEHHSLSSFFNFIKIEKKLEDLELLDSKVDCVFFDAFAPSRQAEMWTTEQLSIVSDQMTLNSILVTYCANGQFKRNLKSLNFRVEGVPGPPGKREMTRAYLEK